VAVFRTALCFLLIDPFPPVRTVAGPPALPTNLANFSGLNGIEEAEEGGAEKLHTHTGEGKCSRGVSEGGDGRVRQVREEQSHGHTCDDSHPVVVAECSAGLHSVGEATSASMGWQRQMRVQVEVEVELRWIVARKPLNEWRGDRRRVRASEDSDDRAQRLRFPLSSSPSLIPARSP
jgi:hypothetical protein